MNRIFSFLNREAVIVAIAFCASLPRLSHAQIERGTHGERQLAKVIAQHPILLRLTNSGTSLPKNNIFFEWVIEQFNRQATESQSRLYYNPSSNLDGIESAFFPASKEEPACLCISSSGYSSESATDSSRWEKVAYMLTYELLNSRHEVKYRNLHVAARDGRIPLQRYVDDSLRLEIITLREANRIYREMICPMLKQFSMSPRQNFDLKCSPYTDAQLLAYYQKSSAGQHYAAQYRTLNKAIGAQ